MELGTRRRSPSAQDHRPRTPRRRRPRGPPPGERRPRTPSESEQRGEERYHLDDRFGGTRHRECSDRRVRVEQTDPEHGVVDVSAPATGGSAPSATAGRCRSPMSRQHLQHAECEREAPPDSAHTTNGVSSATLSVRWYVRNRRTLRTSPALLDRRRRSWRSRRRAARDRPPHGPRLFPIAPSRRRCRPAWSAGPSFTPSPVIATTWPRARSTRAIRSFSSGVPGEHDAVAVDSAPSTSSSAGSSSRRARIALRRRRPTSRRSPPPSRDDRRSPSRPACPHAGSRDRLRDVRPRRVLESDEAEELEVRSASPRIVVGRATPVAARRRARADRARQRLVRSRPAPGPSMAQGSTLSGAPLTRHTPSAPALDMRRRRGSNGNRRSSRIVPLVGRDIIPSRRANASIAASIGSPTAVQRRPGGPRDPSSIERPTSGDPADGVDRSPRIRLRPGRGLVAVPWTRAVPRGVHTSTTAISFRVSVPVLSVQMNVVGAERLDRTPAGGRALCAAMRCAPIASDSVTVGSRPSGHQRHRDADREEEPVARRRVPTSNATHEERGPTPTAIAAIARTTRSSSWPSGVAAWLAAASAPRCRPGGSVPGRRDHFAGLAFDDERPRVHLSPARRRGRSPRQRRRRRSASAVARRRSEVGGDAVAGVEEHEIATTSSDASISTV